MTTTEQQTERKKIDSLNQEAFEVRNLDTERALSLSRLAEQKSVAISYPEGQAIALANQGFCHIQITDYETALEKCFEALRISTENNFEKVDALARYNLGIAYQRLGDYKIALDYLSKSMRYYQQVNDQFEIARCYVQLGFLYGWLTDYDTSLEMYENGLKINRELNNPAGEAACLMGLGQTYRSLKQWDKSGDNLFSSMGIRKRIGDMRGYAATMNAYLSLCFDTGQFDMGEGLAAEGYELATRLGDRMGISRFLVDLGKIKLRQNKDEEAEKLLNEAMEIAQKINLKFILPHIYFFLSELKQKRKNFEKALEYFQKYHEAKEELLSTEGALKAKSLQLSGKIENAQKEAEINRLKNVELKKAHDEIAEKNKDITDSINYAKRIQQALLASESMLKRNLKDFFVFYQPKDIVSGDFYWATETPEEKGKRFYFAVCDCTGHGVPGAFMSLLNISYLNEAITEKDMYAPNSVLDHVRNRLIENISGDGGQDGMDGILVSWDKNRIKYSAANNAPIVVHNGVLKELEADGMPVGKGAKQQHEPFQKYDMDLLKEGDTIYLCTDGFADQFGGPKGKKFKKKNLLALLDKHKHLPLEVQKQNISAAFNEWKGNLEQIDDVLIVGIKI